ncbi:MAG TPA: rhodanese-like domain-containing protein [Gemmatimonadaceae bacterium]
MTTQPTAAPRFRGTPVDLVVDVRSKVEFWMGHLPGAVSLPVERVVEGVSARAGISPSSRILVYCAGGIRSADAAAQLRAAGYRNVVDGGGMDATWTEFTP